MFKSLLYSSLCDLDICSLLVEDSSNHSAPESLFSSRNVYYCLILHQCLHVLLKLDIVTLFSHLVLTHSYTSNTNNNTKCQ